MLNEPVDRAPAPEPRAPESPPSPAASAPQARTGAVADFEKVAAEIERWFGEHGIPNFYQRAKEDLKRRLAAL